MLCSAEWKWKLGGSLPNGLLPPKRQNKRRRPSSGQLNA